MIPTESRAHPTMSRPMSIPTLRRLALSLPLVVASMVGGSTGASAGVDTASFSVEIGSCRVYGSAELATADTFRLVVRDARDHLKARMDVDVAASGFWGPVCVPGGPIKARDTLRARLGGQTIHLLVVPRLTIGVDRVTDVISGVGPPSDEVQGAVQPCYPGVAVCLAGQGIPVPTGLDGSYAYDGTTEGDIDGWGGGVVRWMSLFMDQVFRFRKAPYLLVQAGSAGAVGRGTPGETLHVRLHRNGRVRGTGTATPDARGAWQTTIRHDGVPVPVRVGDRITSDLAPDANLTVRAISITADLAADSAAGRCYPDGPFGVRFFRPNGTELVEARGYGDADAQGDFSLAGLTFLRHGWSMRLFCANAAGDTVKRTVTVP
jgi:hypothetical protein